ncbi:hypothetical protein DYU05_14445 [Mucilaginibacter terrenus]|uniref:Uncharacterized protein n=1 Tax=Mucilaginibacter terrenus TaxID=2482727 RepID=A0A3E2NQW3_9SPHI|nr:hypothetical protein [Mucilaginibacter terrenus]RFZ83331.1 hypothetical protein DYU05_14445 [Mucilaginibacter terrenus]
MKKLYYFTIIILFLTSAISSCKLDAPVYPDGTGVGTTAPGGTTTTPGGGSTPGGTTNPGGGSPPGGTTNPGGGSPPGGITPTKSAGTLSYNYDGVKKTCTFSGFQVITPDMGVTDGNIQVLGSFGGTTGISFSCSGYQAGTYKIDIGVEGFSLGEGTATFTTVSVDKTGVKGSLKGTFSFDATDFTTGDVHHITNGVFDLKQ